MNEGLQACMHIYARAAVCGRCVHAQMAHTCAACLIYQRVYQRVPLASGMQQEAAACKQLLGPVHRGCAEPQACLLRGGAREGAGGLGKMQLAVHAARVHA